MDERDLVEPEGVNAGSDRAMRDPGGGGDPAQGGDPVAGGDPAKAPEQEPPAPAEALVGQPDLDTDEAYGSLPPA